MKINPRTLLPLVPGHMKPVAEAVLAHAEEAAKRLEYVERQSLENQQRINQMTQHIEHVNLVHNSRMGKALEEVGLLKCAFEDLKNLARIQDKRINDLTEALAPNTKAVH